MARRLFVVTGCSRTGLGFTSRVLTALGAPCGHEEVFHAAALGARGPLYWPPNLAGDASWLAAPYLHKLPDGAVILHQVRHPLAVVHGLYSSRFFERSTSHRALVHGVVPETRHGGLLVRCMRYWVEWNRLVESAGDYDDLVYHRFRAEELVGEGVVALAAALGLERDVATVSRVLAHVPGVGRAAERHGMTWERLPFGGLRDEVLELAARYGYDRLVRRDVGA